MTAGLDIGPAPERVWDRRRLVYGDWGWLIRDPLDVLRVAFIAGTVAFALMGRSTAVGLAAACVLLLIARIIDLPRWFDFSLIVALTAIAWGTALSLYSGWFYYDKVVHSVAPFCYSPVLYIVLVRLNVVPDPAGVHTISRRAGIFITTLALGMAVGAGYENVEWIEDELHILGGHFVKSLWDTETDLLCDAGGSLAAAIFLTIWSTRRWTSRRIAVAPATTAPAWNSLRAALGRLRPPRGPAVSAWRRRFVQLPLAAKGVVGIGAGVVLLVWPSPALRTVGVIVAIALVAGAVFDLVELLRRDSGRGLTRAVTGIVAQLAAGTFVLGWPGISQLALLYAVGASSVILAFVEAASLSTGEHSERERWLGGAASAVALVFGIVLLMLPRRSLDAVVAVLGLYLVVLGVLRVVRALEARERTERRP